MEMHASLFNTIISDLNIRTTQITLPIKSNRDFPDLGLRSTLFGPDEPFTDILPDLDLTKEKMPILLLRDSFRCHYFLGCSPDRNQIFLVGPYVHKTLTLAEINHIQITAGAEHADMNYLRQYYHSLPTIRDDNLMYTILHAHCLDTYGPDGFEISYGEVIQGKHAPRPSSNTDSENEFQRDASERIYAIEKQLRDRIMEGNYKGAVAALKKLEYRGAESRLSNTLRNFKNYAIVFNTLCRIAARDGGTPAWEIDRLSRLYSLEIENLGSAPELITLREEMLKEYCRIARETADDTYSPIIRKALDIIHSDFGQHISLEETARDLNISAGYLSGLFRKETGRSFSDYLTDTRIQHAQYMLGQTELPVFEIAADCGIPDSNYFSRMFKQNTGMTPLQYRKTKQK